MKIDDVLKPYADDQPNIMMESHDDIIQRIPAIATQWGPTSAFQAFFDKVVKAITSNSPESLYEISDRFLSLEEFLELYNFSLRDHLDDIINYCPEGRGIDVELNIDRFKQIHRNLIGGFLIMTYKLEKNDLEGICRNRSTCMVKHSSELLFSFKKGEFVVLSKFNPFISEDSV